MLKIPQKVNHALVLLRALAAADGGNISLDGVAKAEGISQGYLEEVARLLRAAGLITGRRGAGGGYVLVRPAAEVTVADVVTAIEGASWSGLCLGESRDRIAKRSPHDALWLKVQAQVMTTLRGITLAQLVTEHA